MRVPACVALVFAAASLSAQQSTPQPAVASTALTIYNEDFAVARTVIPLDLHPGLNDVSTTQVTSHLEPDSVVLRDPSGRATFRIAEQNYDAAVINQNWMLRKYEGKTINFEVAPQRLPNGDGPATPGAGQIVAGKIIRAPGDNQPYSPYQNFGQQPFDNQPLIEVEGQLEFQLPGVPLFPASTNGLLLRPTLRWQIESEKSQHLSAELAYITRGLSWEATYNVVAPNAGETLPAEEKSDLTGWVTIHNNSGTEFPSAQIKLMAGDVAKITPNPFEPRDQVMVNGAVAGNAWGANSVTQKPFDDFHLYDLNRTVSLLNGETKQVQFIDAPGVTLVRSYSFDGGKPDRTRYGYNFNGLIEQRNFGVDEGNTKVEIVESIKNSQANHLGMPLPAGRIRLYRRDADGQMEFVGESMINHTPVDDTVKIVTGGAFDLKATRRQTDYHINQTDRILDESFEIHLTSQKPQPVTVSVIEHMERGENWEIRDPSGNYTKMDSHTVEFPVQVPAKGDATLTYSVRYTW